MQYTVNTCESTAICLKLYDGLMSLVEYVSGYSLVLVHYIGTGELWWIKTISG